MRSAAEDAELKARYKVDEIGPRTIEGKITALPLVCVLLANTRCDAPPKAREDFSWTSSGNAFQAADG